jgi:TonB-linked SusC/RagA family outer membrane protein
MAALGVFALAGSAAVAEAQNAVIRGAVRSDAGEAVAGANVFFVELNIQVATTDAGRFVITVPGDRVRGQQLQLRVRAIGYRPSSRPVQILAGEQTVDFTLASDVNRLEEIVVTGVLEGTEQTKVPFSVARVDMADVVVPPIDPLRMLAGRVPGVNVMSTNGRPGAQPEVILRGPTSINASGRSQGPLYIVDGTIITGDLPSINPSDIEDIEVVRGAAASSLYGARAGAGVIAITTRSGRRSRDGVSFNARVEYGAADIERDFGLARNTSLILDERNERFCRYTPSTGFCGHSIDWVAEAARINNAPGDFALTPLSFALDPGASTNAASLANVFQAQRWPGRVYNAVEQTVTNNGIMQSNLDATGRLGQTQFYASVSGLDQAGALRFGEGFQRLTGRLNVDQRIGSAWSLGLRSFYSRSNEDFSSPSFFRLTRVPGIVNILQRDTLGRLFVRPNLQGSGAQNENPLQEAENFRDDGLTHRFIGGLTLRYAPASWVDIEGQFSYDYRSFTEDAWRDKGFRTTSSGFTAYIGNVYSYEGNEQSFNTSLNVALRRNLGRNLVTRWTLRYLYDQQDNDERDASGNTLNAVGVPTLNNASVRSNATSQYTSVRGISYIAGGVLEFRERYIVDGLIRREGSSLFGERARWGTFGRVSLAWRASQEPWWFGGNTINELKFRASRGSAGNRPRFVAQYETFTVGAGGIGLGTLGNKDLRHEVNVDNEVGADLELFRRIGVNVTYAQSDTRDQILQVPNPSEKGFSDQWQNAGTLQNKTWELSVNLPLIQRRDLSWGLRFTYDRTRTVITELLVPPFTHGSTSQGTESMFQAAQGERYGTFYGRRFITSCAEMPVMVGGTDFRNECGPGRQFQINDEGYVVWTGGFGTDEGITRNLWGTQLAAASAPWGRPIYWGMPFTIRDTTCLATPNASCPAMNLPIGNSLPDYSFSVQTNVTFRRLSVFALFQGVMGREVWNQGRHWAHLDFLSRDIDQAGRSPGLAKPIGYYWRGAPPDAVGIGGFYDALAPHTHFVENSSYGKLRELAVSYNVGPIGGVGNWTASVVGRNLFTITNYTGFDPEVGGANGGVANNALINAVDAFNFPNTRSFTFGVSTSF